MSSALEEPRKTHAPQALTRHPAVAAERQPELLLLRGVDFLRRYGTLVLVLALVAALVAGLFSQLLAADEYKAVAVLIIAPAKFTSTLKTEPLDVRGHQRLLESDAVIAETVARLRQRDDVGDTGQLRVGRDLESRIPVTVQGPRGQPLSHSPLIEIVATAGTPEQAAAIANTWAAVFIEHSRRLVADSTAPTIDLATAEYGRRREEIDALTKRRTDLANEYQKRINEVEVKWMRRIAAAGGRHDGALVEATRQSEELLAAYQAESRRILEQGIGPDPAQGAELRRLASLRVQLSQTLPVLRLEKAISDDALWQTVTMSEIEGVDVELAERTNLLTEEVNPVATELALEVSRLEAGLADPGALAVAARLETLQRERSAGLAALTTQRLLERDRLEYAREIELSDLANQQRLEIESLERERDDRLLEIDQDLKPKHLAFTLVAESYEQALLANAEEQLEDVRLSWPAVPSLEAEPRRTLEKTLIAALVGAVLGLVLALFLEARAVAARGAAAS